MLTKKLYTNSFYTYIVITFLVVLSTLLLWLPFLIKSPQINGIRLPSNSFETILKHWDGPLYIIPAKTLYDVNNPILQQSPLGLNPKYFAAHLPLYPISLKVLSPAFGYPKAILVSTMLFSIILFNFFYYLIKKLKLSSKPFLLTFVFLFFTPRIFVIRSVGSPEPMFILFILFSIYAFSQKKFLLASFFAMLSVITKTPGILLFFAYCLYFLATFIKTKKFNISWLWTLLIPTGLFCVFLLYHMQYGDFFAYFNSGDNLHLKLPPFSVFNFQKAWIGSAWLEDIIFIYFFYLTSILILYQKIKDGIKQNETFHKISLYFMSIFFIAIILVEHKDISRYSIPLLPLALIIYEKFFTSKIFIIVLILLIPALYSYAWNFLIYNIAPITDWTPFL